jgi:cytochrome c
MYKQAFIAVGVAVAMAVAGGPASAGGDAAEGAKVFKKKCNICHSAKAVEKGKGPGLNSIVGAKAGAGDFKKYVGLKGSDIVWSEDNLDKFLADPKGFLGKKTSMAGKLKKPDDRANVIAYLKTLK